MTEPERRDVAARRLRRDIVEGLRFLLADRYLRPLAMYSGLVNLPLGGIDAILVVFLVRTVGLRPGTAGATLAIIGAGGLTGALVARQFTARLGSARALLACAVLSGPFTLLVPLTGPGWAVLCVSGSAVSSAGIVAFNVINASFRQTYCPPDMLGRVAASTFTLSLGCLPLGSVLAGALGAEFGIRTAMWIVTSMMALSGVPLLASPLTRHRDMPTERSVRTRPRHARRRLPRRPARA